VHSRRGRLHSYGGRKCTPQEGKAHSRRGRLHSYGGRLTRRISRIATALRLDSTRLKS